MGLVIWKSYYKQHVWGWLYGNLTINSMYEVGYIEILP